jgi:hypothetical protein
MRSDPGANAVYVKIMKAWQQKHNPLPVYKIDETNTAPLHHPWTAVLDVSLDCLKGVVIDILFFIALVFK